MLSVTLLRSGKNTTLINKLCFPTCIPVSHYNILLQKSSSQYHLTRTHQENQKRYFHVSVVRKGLDESIKIIGAGIAATGVIGPGIGMGLIFGNMLLGISRNPSLAKKLFQNGILGAALVESLGLFALVISFMAIV